MKWQTSFDDMEPSSSSRTPHVADSRAAPNLFWNGASGNETTQDVRREQCFGGSVLKGGTRDHRNTYCQENTDD
jgi:hypothetical protein